MGRSAANRQGNVMDLSGNFRLSGEWSPWKQSSVVMSGTLKFRPW